MRGADETGRLADLLAHDVRDAEVGDPYVARAALGPGAGEEHVVRLNVAMRHASRVRESQCVEHFGGDGERVQGRSGPASLTASRSEPPAT